MIEFDHAITVSEVDSKYINLTDGRERKYGSEIGQEETVFTVIDGRDRKFRMKRHGGNQLTRCTKWFRENHIRPDAVIKIRFDPVKRVLYLLPWSD